MDGPDKFEQRGADPDLFEQVGGSPDQIEHAMVGLYASLLVEGESDTK